MSNILTKDPLLLPSEIAEVYVVYNNRDYRMTLGTLITLVTKASIGLGNVDNTSDQDKPISNAVAAALSNKANSDAVPTLDAFNVLASSLSDYVTLEQLNEAIGEITDLVNGYVTVDSMTTAIEQAIAPVTDALQQFSNDMAQYEIRLAALEAGGGSIDMTAVNQAIADALLVAAADATSKDNTVRTEFNDQLVLIQQTVQLTQDTLTLLQQNFETHTHAAEDITGLQEYVLGLVAGTGCNVVLGDHQW